MKLYTKTDMLVAADDIPAYIVAVKTKKGNYKSPYTYTKYRINTLLYTNLYRPHRNIVHDGYFSLQDYNQAVRLRDYIIRSGVFGDKTVVVMKVVITAGASYYQGTLGDSPVGLSSGIVSDRIKIKHEYNLFRMMLDVVFG